MIYTVSDADQMRELGAALGRVCQPGDVILLVGPMGAGKTTFVQGLGAGLEVEGQVTSPTYIVARVHEAKKDGPDLVHVDAYRLEDERDLETIDLDATAEEAVTAVEWGRGHAENLSPNRLEIEFAFDAEGESEPGDVFATESEPRRVRFIPVGSGWGDRLAGVGK